MCEVLEVLPHKAGGKLTRLEKWHGKLMPNQHSRIKTWGCAAYLHLDYGARGKINDVTKLEPRAQLCVMVGYDRHGMGWRVAELPGFKIHTAVHVTFVEDQFPCRTTINRELPTFQLQLPTSDVVPGPRGRPRRDENLRLSAAALENIAAGEPSPPHDDVQMTLDLLDDIYAIYYDIVHSGTDCPKNIPAALTGLDAALWRTALTSECQQHNKNGTFGPPIHPKDLPPGVKPIPFDCVLKVKRDFMLKVRGIMKGFRMTEGLDYNETFAPVPCVSILRIFFALAAKFDWDIKQGDVRTAFLCAEMDTEVYAAVPNWFRVDATGTETGYTIRRLLKGVPGIPQGPRLFHKKTHGIYTSLGLKQCKSEFCLYFCTQRQLFLVVWVDDLFFFFPKQSRTAAATLWSALQDKLDLDDWQDIDDCLACVVKRDRPNCTIRLTQEPAARKLLLRNNLAGANRKDTPMVANVKLSKKQCPSAEQAAVMASEQRWFRSVIASFIYFVLWTRPDMAYAVSKLCKFMHNPGHDHFVALKRLLRYLLGTVNYGLVYDFSSRAIATKKSGFYGFYDASHADCPDTMRSTLAYLFFFEGCAISWNTKLHTVITTSTNHSEYCAAAKAAKEAKLIEKVAIEVGMSRYVHPVDLFSDSRGCIAMTYNPVQRAASKHIDLADHYAREQQELGTITISFVGTKDMTADLLTKPLAHADFWRHADKLIGEVTL